MMKSSTNVACRENPSIVNFVIHIEFAVGNRNQRKKSNKKNCLFITSQIAKYISQEF